MSGYAPLIVRPPDDEHWQGLVDVAEGIKYALQQLGQLQTTLTGGRQILFNAHRLADDAKILDNAIIFNSEQIQSTWQDSPYIERLKRHTVWDYSHANIDRLHALGVNKVVHCPIGYYPVEPLPVVEQDIDVLFFGTMNERRAMMIFDLAARGLNVEQVFGVYGKKRDDLIARAKIVLNVHYYDKPIFEIFRVAHLLNHKKCVVTEGNGCDIELENLAGHWCVKVPYSQLVDECEHFVNKPGERAFYAERGHDRFKKWAQVDLVEAALKETP